jgi:hypothetical protein
MKRLRVFLTLCACLLACVAAGTAAAQDYPNKPVKVLVGFAPGGAMDIVARTAPTSPQELAALVRREHECYGKLIREADIKAN